MKRILIIEDGELNRDLLIQLLEDDYELSIAIDGEAGIEAARRELPDLILLDLGLPILDGWEVARLLKESDATRPIPVIALTAHAMAGDERRAKECGCDGYITKPIDDAMLLDRISKLVAGESP